MTFLRVNDLLSEAFLNSILKKFMTTPIRVLCSNFPKIVLRELGETMCCFADRTFWTCVIFSAILHPFGGEGHQKFAGECTYVSCKTSSQSVSVCRSYFQKRDFVRPQYRLSEYNKDEHTGWSQPRRVCHKDKVTTAWLCRSNRCVSATDQTGVSKRRWWKWSVLIIITTAHHEWVSVYRV